MIGEYSGLIRMRLQGYTKFFLSLYWLKLLLFILVLLLVFCSSISSSFAHKPEEFLQAIRGKKDEGSQIVQHFCATCHAKSPQIELGAPKISQQADWQARINNGGLAGLIQSTDEGKGAMPPRGGCFECSDEQLYLAIIAMLPESIIKQLKLH